MLAHHILVFHNHSNQTAHRESALSRLIRKRLLGKLLIEHNTSRSVPVDTSQDFDVSTASKNLYFCFINLSSYEKDSPRRIVDIYQWAFRVKLSNTPLGDTEKP